MIPSSSIPSVQSGSPSQVLPGCTPATADGFATPHPPESPPTGSSPALVGEARDQIDEPLLPSAYGNPSRLFMPVCRTDSAGAWFLEDTPASAQALELLRQGQPLTAYHCTVLLRCAGDLIKRGQAREAVALMERLPEGQRLQAMPDAYDYLGYAAAWNVSLDDLAGADATTLFRLRQMLVEARYMASFMHQTFGGREVDMSRLASACVRMQVPAHFPLSAERQQALQDCARRLMADPQPLPNLPPTGSGASGSE